MKSKIIVVLSVVLLSFSSCTSLQKSTVKENKFSIITSNSLVGIWNQVMPISKDKILKSGNFKFINPDGTFYLMMVESNDKNAFSNLPTSISMYGTYEVTSENTLTEHIRKHLLNPKMTGTQSELKYKMLTDDQLLIKYKNPVTGKWIPELWIRIKPYKQQSLSGIVL